MLQLILKLIFCPTGLHKDVTDAYGIITYSFATIDITSPENNYPYFISGSDSMSCATDESAYTKT